MVKVPKSKIIKEYPWIFAGIAASVFYWFLESTIDAFYVQDDSLLHEIINPALHETWMRSVVIALIMGFGIYAQYSTAKIKRSKTRSEELKALLSSIRNINQLIVQETELETLLEKSARILQKTRGYLDASIAILENNRIKPIAHFGSHERKDWSIKTGGNGDAPQCIKQVIESKSLKIIENTEEECKDCDYCNHGRDHRSVIVPMLYKEDVVGIISACFEKYRTVDDKEIELLKEIANDLAFAREKLRMEERIRELNQFRETIIEDANVWLSVFDNEGNIIVWNKAAKRISGYPKEKVIGNDEIWEKIYPNERHRKEIRFVLEKIIRGEKVLENFETAIISKSGEEKIISWNSRQLKDRDENPIGAVAVGRDITEHKNSEERREFLNTLLRQDLLSKSQIVAGYLQLLETVDLSKENQKHLETALKNAKDGIDIIEQVKILKEIEETDLGKIKITKILKDIKEESEKFIEDREIKIVIDKEIEPEYILGEYSLKNLFINLIKARRLDPDFNKIEISFEETAKKIIVKMEDNGSRIPDKIKQNISKESYKGDTSGIEGFRYYIAREIAAHNKAKIEIKDSKLGGTRFDIHLKKSKK